MQFEVDLSLKNVIKFIACVIIFISVVKHVSDIHTRHISEISEIKMRSKKGAKA
ncbi:MAG: hypothetical protein FWD71_18090 [Oscillospiraceae bacterium]|nr:hypothetical protein [Oscillospiraceae bacterium]